MDLIGHIASRNELQRKMDALREAVMSLNQAVIDTRSPAPGPYLLFFHNSALLRRSRQLWVLMRRLYQNRIELLQNDVVLEAARPKTWPGGVPYPIEYQEMAKRGDEIVEQIQLDFETLLQLSYIVLDDLAHLAAYIYDAPQPANSSFRSMLNGESGGTFSELWTAHRDAIIWLDTFTRLFRSKFIVHQKNPWQLGHIRNTHGLHWAFSAPTAPGWLSSDQLEKADAEISALEDKQGLPKLAARELRVIQLLLNAAQFEKSDRDKIRKIAEYFGFQTPSFQEFSHRLADFLLAAIGTISTAAQLNPTRINLGAPGR